MIKVIIDNTPVYYKVCNWISNNLSRQVSDWYVIEDNHLVNYRSIQFIFELEEDYVAFNLAWGELIKKVYIDDS